MTTGDLDGDGRLDIVAANWGLNSDYSASSNLPLRMYHGDLLERGMMDLIETEWDPAGRTFIPRRRLDVLSQVLPTRPSLNISESKLALPLSLPGA